MRTAIFGDIHANLPAFEALLADIRMQSPDALLCLGDVVSMGAWPGECVQLLASLACPVVLGNADEDVLKPRPFEPTGQFEHEREIHDLDEWGRARLTAADLDTVREYRPRVQLPGLLAFHGSPASCRESIGAATPLERLEELRAAHGRQAAWVGGHTHAPLLRTLGSPSGNWRLLNPGSVGLPWEQQGSRGVQPSRAEYLLLDGEQVQFRRVSYDVRMVQDGIRERAMPHADWWAGEWVQG